jgi:hypothetical protein
METVMSRSANGKTLDEVKQQVVGVTGALPLLF